jgi:hypothetical protein
MNQTFTSDIINLNVGGSRFSTSRQTLCSIPDSFFSSLLSGRIPTCRDEIGALFIDRDPDLFKKILSFLRTKELDLNGVDVSALRHEAEFYGITPLVKRLMLCEDLDRSLCGDVLFTGFIPAPLPSSVSKVNNLKNFNDSVGSGLGLISSVIGNTSRPGNVLRLNNKTSFPLTNDSDFLINSKSTHSRNSSNADNAALNFANLTHINASQNFSKSHSRNQSLDLKQVKTELG